MASQITPGSRVAAQPPATSSEALGHFEGLLAFESDCWDVYHDVSKGLDKFVLLDVRTSEQYAEAHIPSAVSLPHGRINERNLAGYPPETVFVTYCAGTFCNAADKAAVHLARLGRPVKKMIGGISGWVEEGFELVSDNEAQS
jgi:rhodanese-related sulfurtransferase